MKPHVSLSMFRLFTVIGLALFIAASALSAQGAALTPIKKSRVAPVNKAGASPAVAPVKAMPDLVVKPPVWSSPPKAGDTLGTVSILNLTVANQGGGAAGASQLKIGCQPLGGASCPGVLNGTLQVDPLLPGKAITYPWPPGSSDKWFPGTYRLTFTTDAAGQVPESNEANNASHLMLTVAAKAQFQKIKEGSSVQKAPARPVLLALPVQSPAAGSEHDAGQPLTIKWSKSLISAYPTVDILLVDAQDGQVRETIKSGAANSGTYNAWLPPQTYAWPGTSYRIKITTPDNKVSGQSGVFAIASPKEKKKVPFILNAAIANGWAYTRGGDLRPGDCMSAPQIPAGRQPGNHEAKIGHFVKQATHGECRYYDEYYFRSRVTFDVDALKGKEIVAADLMIRQGDSIELYPPGSNTEVSSRCDIYRLAGSWPASPQPLYDFFPGTFLKSFSLFGENETAKIDLLGVVQDWAAGQANHGLMLRGPVNRAQYADSASVRYYYGITLVGWYLE